MRAWSTVDAKHLGRYVGIEVLVTHVGTSAYSIKLGMTRGMQYSRRDVWVSVEK